MADVLASLGVLAIMVGVSFGCLLAALYLVRSGGDEQPIGHAARARARARRDEAQALGHG